MSKFYTYILQSQANGRYYTGHTSDLDERLRRHNMGAVRATKGKGPWKIVYYETFGTKKEAVGRELNIKAMKSRNYIESLVKSRGTQ